MDNRSIKIIILILVFSLVFLVSTSIVAAFGISAPYWKNNPLKMYPGQIKEISFNLQNCPSLSPDCERVDENINIVLEEGSEIAEITSGNSYLIPYGTADKYIRLKIQIPNNAKIGDSYNIRFSATAAPTAEGGNVELGLKYNVEFPVVVGEEADIQGDIAHIEPRATAGISTGLIVIIILITIIIIIIIIYWISKKRALVKSY